MVIPFPPQLAPVKVSPFVSLVGCLCLCSVASAQQPPDHAALAQQLRSLRANLNDVQTAFLAPSAQDQLNYAAYINRPDRGLIRLLPGEKYDDANALTVRGGGSFYSFIRLTHNYDFGSDLRLREGNFSVGFAGADYGFIRALGAQDLETLSVSSPGVADLAEHEPSTSNHKAKHAPQGLEQGYEKGDLHYCNHAAAVVGSTYVLRSISPDRSDALVVFSVVRQDMDGSLIIAWRMLAKSSPPE